MQTVYNSIICQKIKKRLDKTEKVLYIKVFEFLRKILWRWNKWQSVQFAERALLSVVTFLTRTEKPTEVGSPTSEE